MNYQLIRSKRKTLSLQINRQAQLVIRAPQRLSVKKIEDFIEQKSSWIEQKMALTNAKKLTKPNYTENEKFLYLGNLYPFKVKDKSNLTFNGVCFYADCINRENLLAWYKSAFKPIALPRLDYYAKTYQLNYQKVRLKTQKTLWGSCSSVNNINLNYLLIMSPISVIDYVIVHELCHTVHKNHSKNFWNLVAQILPNYKTSKRWLQDNGHRLQNL